MNVLIIGCRLLNVTEVKGDRGRTVDELSCETYLFYRETFLDTTLLENLIYM